MPCPADICTGRRNAVPAVSAAPAAAPATESAAGIAVAAGIPKERDVTSTFPFGREQVDSLAILRQKTRAKIDPDTIVFNCPECKQEAKIDVTELKIAISQ